MLLLCINWYNIVLDCLFPEVLCSHMRFAMVALPRNSFRVRRLSSPSYLGYCQQPRSNHKHTDYWKFSFRFYVLSTTVWIIRYDHQPNAGCGRAGCPLVLMSSCTNHNADYAVPSRYIFLLFLAGFPSRFISHNQYRSHKHCIET